MTVDELEELLAVAYDAGFAASGEGWNGEYPDDGDITLDSGYRETRHTAIEIILGPEGLCRGLPRLISEEEANTEWRTRLDAYIKAGERLNALLQKEPSHD